MLWIMGVDETWVFWHIFISCCVLNGSHNRQLLSCTSGKCEGMYSLQTTGNFQHSGGHRSAKYALNIFLVCYEAVKLSFCCTYPESGLFFLCVMAPFGHFVAVLTFFMSSYEHSYSFIIIRLSYLHCFFLRYFCGTFSHQLLSRHLGLWPSGRDSC